MSRTVCGVSGGCQRGTRGRIAGQSSHFDHSSALIKNPAREGSGRGAPPFRAGVSTPPRHYRGGHGRGPGGAGQGSQAERHGPRGVTSPRGMGRNRGPQAAKHPNRDGQTHRAGSGAGLPRGAGARRRMHERPPLAGRAPERARAGTEEQGQAAGTEGQQTAPTRPARRRGEKPRPRPPRRSRPAGGTHGSWAGGHHSARPQPRNPRSLWGRDGQTRRGPRRAFLRKSLSFAQPERGHRAWA